MVKCDKGTTEISGTKSQILAEFTMIIRGLRDCEHINDEEITGLMADKLADILAKIAERMKEGDESGDD